jgi:hypothetical protein
MEMDTIMLGHGVILFTCGWGEIKAGEMQNVKETQQTVQKFY